jgi:hypothetical protein
MKLSALKYYISSLPTLVGGVDFYRIPLLFLKKPVLLNIAGGYKIYVRNLLDVWTLKEVILDDNYYAKDISENTVVDVGSALGDFSILVSDNAKRVLAFDPDRGLIKLMRRNLKMNNVTNVETYQEAVTSLNELFSKYRLGYNCFVKVDCEGAEYGIFKNVSSHTLKKIDRIAFEIHFFNKGQRDKYRNLKKRLVEAGFKLTETPNPVHEYLRFLYASRV